MRRGWRSAHWFPARCCSRSAVRARLRAVACAAVRLSDPAPARRLLLAADAGAGRACSIRSPSAGPRSPAARTASAASRGRCRRHRSWRYLRAYYALVAAIGFVVVYVLWRFHRSPVGTRAGRDPRERAARPLHRLSGQPLQAARLRGLGDHHRARRHAAAVQQPDDLGRPDLGRLLGRAPGDGRHRRHAHLSSAPRSGRSSSSSSATTCPAHRELAALLRPACSSASSCSRQRGWSGLASGCSRRSRRNGRGRGHGGSPGGRHATARLPEADGLIATAPILEARASPRASAASKPCRTSSFSVEDRTCTP